VTLSLPAQAGSRPAAALEPFFSRQQYVVDIHLDYRAATYTGRETIRFINAKREELDSVLFALYPNYGLADNDPLALKVQSVKLGSRELRFSLRARGALLRVELPAKLQPQQSLELTLSFAAKLPRVPKEEAGLYAHFLQELSDATGDERQVGDARDIFFAGDGAIVLGHFFPLLVGQPMPVGEPGLVAGASSAVFSEVADYEVSINADEHLQVIASGLSGESTSTKLLNLLKISTRWSTFRAEKLRGFALVIGENFKQAEQRVGDTRVVSYYREADERVGKRVLEMAARAVEIYNASFGPYPYPQLQVFEAPLPAGYSGVDLPGLVLLAQAYYVDFDSTQAARLPGIVREQSDVIKAALEFTLAHGIAHQWWGGAVGSDPQRVPYMDEALATFAAAYYHEAAYGAELGKLVVEQQLRGAYHLYRLFGGADMEVEKPAKDFRSALQYSAIVQAKGALWLVALRKELGDQKFFDALRAYYAAYQFQIVSAEYLRFAFLAAAEEPRVVRALYQRWLKEKHGDEDIGLAEETALAQPASKMRSLGRMLMRIGRSAVRPF
jgi:aminopeptidase N